jgi:hypothetical protein
MMAQVSDVFVAGGMPSLTYVGRDHLNLESDLLYHLSEGFKITCVTGPTKSGKTVLYRKALDPNRFIVIEGAHVRRFEDFLSEIRSKVSLPDSTSRTSSTSNDGSGGVNIGALKALEFNVSTGRSKSESSTQIFNTLGIGGVLGALRRAGHILVIDDFHFIAPDVQKEIVRSVKAEVFDGLKVVLVAVPHRVFDAITVEQEMQGRFASVQIPEWSLQDLREISRIGFDILKMNVPLDCQESFSKEAFSSPLLMQSFCRRLCHHFSIEESQANSKEYNPSDVVRQSIFESVSRMNGLPNFDLISKGPQERSPRKKRRLINGAGVIDIYKSVVQAVANTGPKNRISYNEIREEIMKILVPADVPNKNQITSTISKMAEIARERIKGEPIIEWSEDTLYITDPFLMFYMRWHVKGVS